MYRLIDIPGDAKVIYKLDDGREVEFHVEPIINRRLRDDIDSNSIFYILNRYIEFKGQEFREMLFDVLVDAKNTLNNLIFTEDIDPLPLYMVHNVLNLFTLEDVIDYINRSKIITPPTKLPEEFDENIEKDERGTRVQTYLKNDYIELIALLTIMKAAIPVIGEFAYIKQNQLSNASYKEFILFSFYYQHPIFKSEPMQKILRSIEKLTNKSAREGDNIQLRIVDKFISLNLIPLYIMSKVLIDLLLTNNELKDSDVKNTITKIYSSANNKLNYRSTTNTLYFKPYTTTGTNDEQDNVIESYRTPTDITAGVLEELEFAFSDLERLKYQLNITSNMDEIGVVRHSFENFRYYLPIKYNIYIISWLYKHIVDPRAFDYIGLDSIINAFTIGFLWLWENDFKDLAMIISSYGKIVDEVKLTLISKTKVDPNLKEELNRLFPYSRVIKPDDPSKNINYVEETVNALIKELGLYTLITSAPDKYVIEYNGSLLRNIALPDNIKNRLIEYIIRITSKKD